MIGCPDVEENWGPLLQTLETNNSYGFNRIALSLDGKLLACPENSSIKLWNPATGALRSTLEGFSEVVTRLAFSPDGQLASACHDSTVRLWDPITAVVHKELKLEVPSVKFSLELEANFHYPLVAFAPNGALAVVSWDTKLRFWDWKSGTISDPCIADFNVLAMAFLSDGRLILLHCALLGRETSHEREVLLYDPSSDTVQKVISAPVSDIAVSLELQLALGLKDGTVLLHNLRTGSQRNLESHHRRIVSLCFSNDGKHLASVSHDGNLRVHDLLTRESMFLGSDRHKSTTFSHNGKLLASATFDDTIQVWNPHTHGQPDPYESHSRKVRGIELMIVATDGRKLAYGCSDGRVHLLDLKSRSSQNLLPGDDSEGVQCVAFSPDGRLLASSSERSTSISPVRIWDVATGNLQCEWEVSKGAAEILAFSPDIRQLASGGRSGDLIIWDITTGSQLFELKRHRGRVASIVFSPNGKQLASSNDHSIRVWDTSSGILQFTLDSHFPRVELLAFSHSGDQLASGSADKKICVWDPMTGSRLKIIHTERSILGLSYSAHGLYIEMDNGESMLEDMSVDGAALALMPRNKWRLVNEWLVHGGRRILWLPPDFRPPDRRFAVQNEGLFVLGIYPDELKIMEVDPDFSPEERVF